METVDWPLAAPQGVFIQSPLTVPPISTGEKSQNGSPVPRSSTVGTGPSLYEGCINAQQDSAEISSRDVAGLNEVLNIWNSAKQPLPARLMPLKPCPTGNGAILSAIKGIRESEEAVEKPKRRRLDLKKKAFGPNRYGRTGTLRCLLCRKWRQKACLIATEDNFSAYMMRKTLKSLVVAATNAAKNAKRFGAPASNSIRLASARRTLCGSQCFRFT